MVQMMLAASSSPGSGSLLPVVGGKKVTGRCTAGRWGGWGVGGGRKLEMRPFYPALAHRGGVRERGVVRMDVSGTSSPGFGSLLPVGAGRWREGGNPWQTLWTCAVVNDPPLHPVRLPQAPPHLPHTCELQAIAAQARAKPAPRATAGKAQAHRASHIEQNVLRRLDLYCSVTCLPGTIHSSIVDWTPAACST